MTEISDRYRRLSDAFADRIAAVPDDGWGSPTPCPDWNVRELVGHVVGTQDMFLQLVGRSMPDDLPSADDDPAAAWNAARAVMQADLDDPARAGVEFQGYQGPSTFEAAVDRFLNFDLVVHGWDLARATGRDETIDPDDLARIDAASRHFGEGMRSPSAFGPEVSPPSGADDQTRVLAFLGRRV